MYQFNYIGTVLERDLFNTLLKNANLSKKEFAANFGLSYQTVNAWGSTQNIPYWVKSWLENYIKAKNFDEVINAVKPYINTKGAL